ncbi:DUF1847 domain-containing protein [Cetobacterium sp.]|uniref:DUF1847 domain-containing protein n=1 Tax=Cetobacterium sp. TaxID=2071632 RepID=UPI003EE7AE07
MYSCANCKVHGCREQNYEKMPKNCPSRDREFQEENKLLYLDEENYKLAHNSALVESEGYCRLTRVEEIMEFAKKNNFTKIGLAFCVGLRNEAEIFTKILENRDFEVCSIICKNGSVSKEFIGISDCEKVRPGTNEVICNPIGQARLLNKMGTQLNVMLGLCVGHDSLFMKYSEALATVLAVKDRVTGHNPLAPLYISDTYYHKKLFK